MQNSAMDMPVNHNSWFNVNENDPEAQPEISTHCAQCPTSPTSGWIVLVTHQHGLLL